LEILTAEYLGFCFGVRNAVETASKIIREGRCAGAPVYSVGPIIHNRRVVADLEREGLITVDNIEQLPFGAFALVRSHGEGKPFFDCAAEKRMQLIDTTCPKVRRIREIVRQAYEVGDAVVIIGDPEHPEVKGLNGWCAYTACIIESEDEARQFAEGVLASERSENYTGVTVVSQTTFDSEQFASIAKILSDISGISIHNTICSATENRQSAARDIAGKADIMLVIGDKSSSNTRKLYEISKKRCKNTFFIDNINDLPLQVKYNCNKIGVIAGASTPDGIIKEVITRMKQFNNEGNENNPMFEFMEEIDKALKLPRNGDIVTGEVIQVTDKDVIINIGCKKDGVIPRNEVSLEQEQTLLDVFKEGDEVQAKVLKTDDGDGNILLSKKRVVISEHWDDINKALEDRSNLEVMVVKEVNGGVIALMGEITGFIPMSQISDRYIETAADYVGKALPVKVMRVDQKRNKVVFSHKAVLNEERQKRMMEIWDTINVGDIIDGKVMRFTEYGAFVDIGGIDGLLHISEISWGKLRHPSELLSLGQEIKVKVLSMNKEKEKISLGYKQNLPEPWSIINEKFTVGQIIQGKAVQIKDYGVFVELEPGLDGLVHISEIAHRRVNIISDEIVVGQDITAKILEIDKDRKRISLSIRQTIDPKDEEAALAAAVAKANDSDSDLEMPDADAEPETNAEEAAEVFEEAEAERNDADFEMPDADAEPETNAEEAAEVFEEAEAERRDADLEMPDADAEPETNAEEAAEVFEEAEAERKDADFEMPDADAEPETNAEESAEVFEEAEAESEENAETSEEPESDAITENAEAETVEPVAEEAEKDE
jgi:4-hydroxy-3-methylbut-2-enyl diphosphate reductase